MRTSILLVAQLSLFSMVAAAGGKKGSGSGNSGGEETTAPLGEQVSSTSTSTTSTSRSGAFMTEAPVFVAGVVGVVGGALFYV